MTVCDRLLGFQCEGPDAKLPQVLDTGPSALALLQNNPQGVVYWLVGINTSTYALLTYKSETLRKGHGASKL